ncbi:thiamine pyrophosphate-requiring protein [Rhodoplanes sp. Z2-YC6860]|uniref:thiamine pyrophosphate-requiring protein n=1 Tax=Rhodoplanes sp. Z2-YC6860 TaxID=674703 RepID=UPI00078E0F0D|nr:thiamine pyrophosphate-requiring protein [Rhodoplanes sp. Z2-YC6860]AMN41497.1 thiamine pyrophosphate protein domain-containing protein TPP-binding protein [Rhodoplanes sp. Z2-YC6860]
MHAPKSEPHHWTRLPATEAGDAIVAAMALGGVDHLFFISGSEIMFFQEAIAKAQAHGRTAPKLITITHEYAGLNAALGYAAVTGRPAATAAHVDVGTQHYGCALHTAWWAGLPILIMAGAPPSAYPGTMRGGRDGAHFWLQQTLDQNGIARAYTKWDHRLEYQDNPGLIVSRALQVAQSQPSGPVYLSLPREIAVMPTSDACFPSCGRLAVARPSAPDPDGIRTIAERLVKARNPYVVVSRSGKNAATVPALVELCELTAMPVVDGGNRTYQCFPFGHWLYQGSAKLADADLVIVLDADVPWPPESPPPRDAYVAVVGADSVTAMIPTFEFCADLRLNSDPLNAIKALTEALRQLGPPTGDLLEERTKRWKNASTERHSRLRAEALALATKTPIDPAWLAFQICEALDYNCIMIDDTLSHNPLSRFLKSSRPGSYFRNPGSGGGWGPGAALGAKLGAPGRDVVTVTGDGFYMYSAASACLMAARRYNAPYMTVVFQNRSYSTGTRATASFYPDGYSVRSGLEGGYFDPIDFAKEAEAAGAYGENVRDPAEVAPALQRGLAKIRSGIPAVISVWLPRHLQTT